MLTQPVHISLGIVPRDINHRSFAASPPLILWFVSIRRLSKTVIFLKGHLIAAHRKAFY
ncbi:hypothetical protein THIOM_000902 [Candidatus Thiomargarita nelsonii]|uniref:Uncharacterized protein n=1 Tax=Candidatus Thiomargarita nelsonii TaxID=1003181 RepID=A0A176S5I6_9GAMM|nr:hypothetical protein THIOM_000902 [Candidatus Thiomargarita nelsonii]